MSRKFFILSVLLAMVVCAEAFVFGQAVRGRIEGTVKDPQGQVVPNVSISIVNIGTGENLQTTTSEEGVFVVPEVKPGAYQVSAETTGFKKSRLIT